MGDDAKPVDLRREGILPARSRSRLFRRVFPSRESRVFRVCVAGGGVWGWWRLRGILLAAKELSSFHQ